MHVAVPHTSLRAPHGEAAPHTQLQLERRNTTGNGSSEPVPASCDRWVILTGFISDPRRAGKSGKVPNMPFPKRSSSWMKGLGKPVHTRGLGNRFCSVVGALLLAAFDCCFPLEHRHPWDHSFMEEWDKKVPGVMPKPLNPSKASWHFPAEISGSIRARDALAGTTQQISGHGHNVRLHSDVLGMPRSSIGLCNL